ncbi:MAG: hypothetical protein NVS9B15_12720 [Acidobacteriaceae bacterium]
MKRRIPVILPRELVELTQKGKRLTRMHAMFTFDDGYQDNYEVAYPILKDQGIAAVFFLISSYLGTNTLSWWDEIAYLARKSPRDALQLTVPIQRTVRLDDREQAIWELLAIYKSPANTNPEAFLQEIREQTNVALPSSQAQFMTWQQAAELAQAGMEVGSHTHTHRILSKLSAEEQLQELQVSKSTLESRLGIEVCSLAYPRGKRDAFDQTTEQMAAAAGYKIAFSFYGGVNRDCTAAPFDVKRVQPAPDMPMFRTEAALFSTIGHLPY